MIGDLLLTLPALARIKERWPASRVEVITLGPAAALASCLPWIDRVFRWNKLRPNLATLQPLFGGPRPDLTLDFSGTDRAALFTALGRQRLGYAKYTKDRPLRRQLYTATSRAILKRQHASQYYLGLLEPLGLSRREGDEPPPLRLVPPAEAEAEAESALHAAGLGDGRPFLVLHPGSARPEKFWPSRHWAELVSHLARAGHRLVLLGGNARAERDHIERIELFSSKHPPLNLAGQLSLAASVALLRRARAAIGVDSALMHLAAAWQLPQLALFGPTDPFHWGPWNAKALSLHASLPDRPRGPLDWRHDDLPPETPLKQLAVEPVLAAVERLGL